MKTLDAEIFAVGTWNGMPFTQEDLANIAKTFDTLGERMRVALKLGHNDEQKKTDGEPALGWVDKVWVQGEKLMARLTDLPDVVYEAIKKKLYRNVSVELSMDVDHKGTKYPYVLTGVALLGADVPAVNTLKDLKHYMSRNADFSVGRHAVFSAIAGNTKGEGNMDPIEKLTAQVADLTAKFATLSAQNATLTATNAEQAARIAKFEADKKADDAAAAKAKTDAKRKEVTALFEAAVKDGSLIPAQREHFSKLLNIDDDAAVNALNIENVKLLLAGQKKGQFKSQGAGQGSTTTDDKEGDDMEPSQQLAKAVAEVRIKNPELDFMAAQRMVFSANPELARAYIMRDEERSQA